MAIKVTYSTEGFLHRNNGEPGGQCERVFASVEEALAAPHPDGYTSAYFQLEGGCYNYSKTDGWDFQPKPPFEFDDSERVFLSEMRALALDEKNREVFVGLSLEETVFYVTHTRMRGQGTPDSDPKNRDRYLQLHSKHEWHRQQVVALGTAHVRRN